MVKKDATCNEIITFEVLTILHYTSQTNTNQLLTGSCYILTLQLYHGVIYHCTILHA